MLFGSGIIQGMLVTLKNFFASYFRKADQGGLFTVEYPEKRIVLREHYRNLPVLIYDESPDEPRCVACDICAKECPPKCITVERAVDANGKPLKKPSSFSIDAAICMNCGICEEVCPFDSIFMDKDFEVATADSNKNMLLTLPDLLRSNEYLKKIRPEDAARIEAKKAAKARPAQPVQEPGAGAP